MAKPNFVGYLYIIVSFSLQTAYMKILVAELWQPLERSKSMIYNFQYLVNQMGYEVEFLSVVRHTLMHVIGVAF